MSKLITGVSTSEDFIKAINEKGAELNINSTPYDLLTALNETGSKVSYSSPNEVIVSQVNEEPVPSKVVMKCINHGLLGDGTVSDDYIFFSIDDGTDPFVEVCCTIDGTSKDSYLELDRGTYLPSINEHYDKWCLLTNDSDLGVRDTTKTKLTFEGKVYVGEDTISQLPGWEDALENGSWITALNNYTINDDIIIEFFPMKVVSIKCINHDYGEGPYIVLLSSNSASGGTPGAVICNDQYIRALTGTYLPYININYSYFWVGSNSDEAWYFRDKSKTTLTLGDQVYVGEDTISQLPGWDVFAGDEMGVIDAMENLTLTGDIKLDFYRMDTIKIRCLNHLMEGASLEDEVGLAFSTSSNSPVGVIKNDEFVLEVPKGVLLPEYDEEFSWWWILTGNSGYACVDNTRTTLTIGNQVYVGDENISQVPGWENFTETRGISYFENTNMNDDVTLEFYIVD